MTDDDRKRAGKANGGEGKRRPPVQSTALFFVAFVILQFFIDWVGGIKITEQRLFMHLGGGAVAAVIWFFVVSRWRARDAER